MAASNFRSNNITIGSAQLSGNLTVSGDFVASGSNFDGNSLYLQKDIEKGMFVVSAQSNTNKIYLPGDDSDSESTSVAYFSFVVPAFSGSLDKLILREHNGGTFRRLSDLGGLTGSFQKGNSGTAAEVIDTSPDFTENVFVDVSSNANDTNVEIVFSGSLFNPGDVYTIALQPDNNWETIYLGYTVLTSHKINS